MGGRRALDRGSPEPPCENCLLEFLTELVAHPSTRGNEQSAQAFMAKQLGDRGYEVDRWQIAEIEVPCHCLVDAGIVPPGRGEPGADRTDGVDFRAMISATPETETTMHLFYAQARNFAHDDEELAQVWVREFRDLFLEDVAVMEAQQEVYARVPDAHLIDINSDAPHLAMRRLLAEHIARERSRDAGAA